MANEWFIQHGGKKYGPLTSANLKKLASDGKITPTTTVRLGAEGNWVPASRVQGLFPSEQLDQSLMPPQGRSAPPAPKAAAPPLAPPLAPLQARPLAAAPLRTLAPPSRAAPASTSVAPRILGAVAVVFGALALTTFWLPLAGQTGALGWTGIVVGALGLLLGIGGFVLSAVQNGAGLYLNIAGTASSIVGLVLTLILGVMAGMFTTAAPPVARLPPPVQLPPAPVEEPPPAEPEPPPEPIWTNAGESIEQGPIKASITAVGVEKVRLENADLATMRRQPPKPMLKVKVKIENISTDKIVEVPGWIGGSELIPQGLNQVLEGTDVGKAVQSAAPVAKLNDNTGNPYKQSTSPLFGTQLSTDFAVRPAANVEKELIFPPPLLTIEYLRLELSPAGFGGQEPLRFEIPKSMITGLETAAP